jgi:ubiquinone/menaquinone biosynthesis C-methylase UbiE
VLSIENTLNELIVTGDMNAAEFGCGTADFAIKLAGRLNKGKVYALDILEEKLSALKGRLNREHITNITTILCDVETERGSTLPDQSLDLVLIPNILFQSENKIAIIKEAQRVLKPRGQLLVIDWLKKIHRGHGEHLISPDEVKKMAATLWLTLKKEFTPGEYHYALIFTK